MYCFNSNPQTSNQFATYPNYHHDQFLHHHYPQYTAGDENHHHYIPYESGYAATNDRQENVATFQSANNDLYEFLPEEIFQLDQPIVKNEAPVQNFNSSSTPIYDSSSVPPVQSHIYNSNPVSNQNFDHLNGNNGINEIQSGNSTNFLKYTSNNYSEINNNSNFNNSTASQTNEEHYHQRVIVSTKDIDLYNYHATTPESPAAERTRKHSNFFQSNQIDGNKRDNNNVYFFQQPAYYIPDIHPASSNANKSSTNDFINRSVEKYNNYVVNH